MESVLITKGGDKHTREKCPALRHQRTSSVAVIEQHLADPSASLTQPGLEAMLERWSIQLANAR